MLDIVVHQELSPVTTCRQAVLTRGRTLSSRPQASSISSIPLSRAVLAPAWSRSPAIARSLSARFSCASVRSSGRGQSAPVTADSPRYLVRLRAEAFSSLAVLENLPADSPRPYSRQSATTTSDCLPANARQSGLMQLVLISSVSLRAHFRGFSIVPLSLGHHRRYPATG